MAKGVCLRVTVCIAWFVIAGFCRCMTHLRGFFDSEIPIQCVSHTHTCPTTGSLHAPRDVLKLVGSLLALINRGRNWRAQ